MTSQAFQLFADHVASYGLEIQCAMDGPLSAKVAIIGEYPGETEVMLNKPFVGGSGKHLWNCLRKLGFIRTDVYATNVVKRRANARHPVQHGELQLWKEALHYELSNLPNLEIIICLGNAAMEAILGFEGIQQHRGSVYEHDGKQVLCTYNPAFVMRAPENEIVLLMDLSKAKDLINGDYKPHYIKKITNPTFDEVMVYLDQIQRVHKKVSLDIETLSFETVCIGLAPNAHEAMCINFRDDRDNRYTIEQEYKILRRLAEVLDDPDVWVVAQNGNFDSHFMGYKNHLMFKVDFDTLLAHHTLYPLLPHNLGFLTAQYTTHPFYKDEKDKFKEGGDIEAFWRYNCTDAAITMAIAEKLIEELKDQGLYEFFTTHVMQIQPELIEATVCGELVDQKVKSRLNEVYSAEVSELYNDFQRKVRIATNDLEHDEVNPNSPKQLTKLIFDKLKCQYHRRSADVHAREAIIADPRTSFEVKDMLIALGRYAEKHKFFSTYVETRLDPDGRFRAEYKQFGVAKAPGRLSSSGTLWGTGGNAQNQPHSAYEMYIADNGCVFLYFDLAQAEARYVGWDANIEKWIEDFERARIDGKYDAHRALASDMFNIPYDEVPSYDFYPETFEKALEKGVIFNPDLAGKPTVRFVAKRCRHGLNYRMQVARLALTTGMDYGQAARNFYIYHNTNPELGKWWKELERTAIRDRKLFNSYGRRWISLGRIDDNSLDSIIAFRPQSTIGDKVQRVWKQCHSDDRWDKSKARIFRNVHDALWAVSLPSYAMTALSMMKQYAEEPIMVTSIMTKKTTPMIIPADCKMSVPDEFGIHRMSNMKAVEVE